MKIAIVHPYPVWSRALGGTTRVHMLVRHLAERHDVHVFAHASGDAEADRQAIHELVVLGATQRLFPRPRGSALKKLGWALGSQPYFVGFNRNPALEAALAELDRDAGLDVVHLEFAYLAPLLGGLGPRPARILAEQEMMSVMIERLRAVPGRQRSLYQLYITRELGSVKRFEARALRTFDRVFAINQGEAAITSSLMGGEVPVLPHVVSASSFRPPEREPDEPSLLFVGNYSHDPNRHALLWFVEEIWPTIRSALPNARFDVVGPGLPEAEAAVLAACGARLLGRVEDLAAAYRDAALFVNPIRSGGGMRGKVLEAFASGRAVLSTRLGMEGIAAEDGLHCDLADDAAGFAQAAIALLRDPALRRERGLHARVLVERLYDAPIVFATLERAYEAAVFERRAHLPTQAGYGARYPAGPLVAATSGQDWAR